MHTAIVETIISRNKFSYLMLGKTSTRLLAEFALGLFLIVFLILITGCNKADESKSKNKDTAIAPATTTVSPVAAKQTPWELPAPPPKSAYDGPLFSLSHNYPKTSIVAPNPAPWQVAIGNKTINTQNADKYVKAVKHYIAKDMKAFLFDYPNWNPDTAQWFNQPWLSKIRDPIHGSYQGSTFPKEMFPQSGLTTAMTTHVFVYYDKVSASSLQSVWGESGMTPVPGINAGGAQFAEGSIIVKPAFTSANGDAWPPMKGAYPWKIWAVDPNSQNSAPVMQTVGLFQFDIIVKDTKSAPDTGWVFATLVYDQRVKGDDWEKMVVLGAMWGNDPTVISPQGCDYLKPKGCPVLAQTWINPAAPLYAKETLGWGGRLSGPNDAAVDITAVVQNEDGSLHPYSGRYAMSSCMACHTSAEYEMKSFLIPAPAQCTEAGDNCTPTFAKCDSAGVCKKVPPSGDADLIYYKTASPEFMRWFQNRLGNVAMDKGAVALDYDMNYAFKALPYWSAATGVDATPNFIESFNNYRGLKHDK